MVGINDLALAALSPIATRLPDADVVRFILHLDATAQYAVRRLVEIAHDPDAQAT
jgi:hypothetical protein